MQRRAYCLISVLAVLALLLSGCGGRLSEDFDAQVVEDSAKTFIERLDTGDFEGGVTDFIRADLREALSASILSAAYAEYRAAPGAFVGYKAVRVVGQHDKATDSELAVAVLQTEYEHQTLTYTVVFDTDLWITGFYFK